jgi:hypothetical protein
MASKIEENDRPTEGHNDSEQICNALEELAKKAEAMLEMMEAIMEDVPKCESAKIATAESYICEAPAEGNITIIQPSGIELTLDLCAVCYGALMKRSKELNE